MDNNKATQIYIYGIKVYIFGNIRGSSRDIQLGGTRCGLNN